MNFRFNTNDQDVLCALGEVALDTSPSSEAFTRVSNHYGLQRELLEADQAVLQNILKTLIGGR